MKYTTIILLMLPTLLAAQEFQFRQEFDTIPVEINSWYPFAPWTGGMSESNPALADFDADGDLDFFVGTYQGNLELYINSGNAFNADFNFQSYDFDSISVDFRLNPCFRDMDADGDLDLVISDDWPHALFYRNMGTPQNPTYILENPSIVPGPPWCNAPELVDIDADGDYDLFGGGLGTIAFWQNTGTPQNFQFILVTGTFAGVNVGDWSSPEFCDIDSDGDYDLFVGNSAGKIFFYRNDGDSTNYNFTLVSNNYINIDVGNKAAPEFADIDGDSDFDLFIGRQQETTDINPGDIFFYKNIGTPQVAQWQLVTKNYISLDVGYAAQSAMTDIDADSDRDIFIQHTGDRLSFYENTGTAQAAAYTWVTDSYQDISVNDAFPEFGDIDSDGDPDLLMGEGAIPGPPSIYLFQNRGTPQNASFSLYSSNFIPGVFTQASVINALALADIDADGDLDLFTSDQDRHLYFFQNDGTAQSPLYNLITTNWQNVFHAGIPTMLLIPMFYDIDGDGDLDLFCGGNYGINQLWYFQNMGTPQNAQMVLETQTFFGECNQNFYGLDIFDIDQDGDGDFLLSTGNGGMVFFRNITGDSSGVSPPPVQRHPQAGLQISLGPNPANPNTVISFSLPSAQQIDLSVYNLLGARVATLASGLKPPGIYTIPWDASANASGVYIVRLRTPSQTSSQRLTIIK